MASPSRSVAPHTEPASSTEADATSRERASPSAPRQAPAQARRSFGAESASTSTPRADLPPLSLPPRLGLASMQSSAAATPASPRASAMRVPTPSSPLASTSQSALGRGRPTYTGATGSSAHARTLSFANATEEPRSASRTRTISHHASITDSEEPVSAGEEDVRTQPLRRALSTTARRATSSARPASRVRTKAKGSSSESDNDNVVLPPIGSTLTATKREKQIDEDDEVKRMDRGEELIKRRMRERKRTLREKERLDRIRRDEEARREKYPNRDPKASTTTARQQMPSATRDPGIFSDGEGDLSGPMSRRGTATSARNISSASYPAAEAAYGRSPRLDSIDDWQSTNLDALRGGMSPSATTPGPNRPLHSASGAGGPAPAVDVNDVFSEAQQDDVLLPRLAREDTRARTSKADKDERSQDSRVRIEEEPEDPDDDAMEDEEEEDINPNDVEYTLKDRQDAINAEHPFGLPIWKPALYKKSRSVTRNAENALHLVPSAAAERHLLPGNVIWAVLFGSWLCTMCILAAALLWLIPFGGSKYGRVTYELGIYLLWPFGRYVETLDVDNEAKEVAALDGYDEMTDDEDDYENESYDQDDDATGSPWNQGDCSMQSSVSASGTLKAIDDGPLKESQATIVSRDYGTMTPYKVTESRDGPASSGSETAVTDASPPRKIDEERQSLLPLKSGRPHMRIRVRALGRLSYWLLFYLIIAPLMLIVCLLCWGLVFTIPMAKLTWVLVWHLKQEPLMLHFRSPPTYHPTKEALSDGTAPPMPPKLKPGYRAPKRSKRRYEADRAGGRIVDGQGKILLCTYRAMGFQYYKYTVDGVNILFINLMPLVFFVIIAFFFIRPDENQPPLPPVLHFVTGDAFLFVASLLSVIPLSYFIGMAVASISAQSSIGMGSVINATFGSIIEILLYSFALVQGKADLVEGSIIGSLLAGVLLMPGLSMIGGAFRRKEQRFNARSAGVTSTMLIMAIIGVLTPTLFYETYGTFQLSCSGCPPGSGDDSWRCDRCVYEHINPTDDIFYQDVVKHLSYYCAIILVASYIVGLWFSLRTHASQIWQNAQGHPVSGVPSTQILPEVLAQRQRSSGTRETSMSVNKSAQTSAHVAHLDLPPSERPGTWSALPTPAITAGFPFFQRRSSNAASDIAKSEGPPPNPDAIPVNTNLGQILDWGRAIKADTERRTMEHLQIPDRSTASLRRRDSHLSIGAGQPREVSQTIGASTHPAEESHGGHDAPNWSRLKSASVLLACTALYTAIAEILVHVVDVVLEGSDIPEKFLGITLFALVPNTTEFLNAISFAINGNIALSMEIGSAYAIQVCLLQIPAMMAFTAWYSIGKESMLHRAFTLVFPRWDVISILFSVFLLTYTYIEARANYFRGTTLCLSYLALLGGFYWAPANIDRVENPILMASVGGHPVHILRSLFFSLWSR